MTARRSGPGDPVPVRPVGWSRPSGYSDGVSAPQGRIVFVAGQIGWNAATRKIVSPDFALQADRALANVVAVLAEAGAEPRHLTRMTWYVTDQEAYMTARKAVGEAYRRHIGNHYPAMSVVIVAGLIEPGAKLEIEATAVVGDS